MISKELLSEVLGSGEVDDLESFNLDSSGTCIMLHYADLVDYINIHELAHKNLKQWAKLKNVFDIIDWSEEPEQIFKKAEELRNEIN